MASKHFCFTLNNPTEDPEVWIDNFLEKENPTYICIGLESATTGTPHFQGYVQFSARRRFQKLAKKYKASFFAAKGTDQHNVDYCSKEGNFHERGERVDLSHGGKRTAGDTIAEACANIRDDYINKRPKMEILHDYPHLSKHVDSLTKFRPNRTTAPKVLYIYGTTGHGKSYNTRRACEDMGLSMYWKPSGDKWWPNYDNEDVVILEEFTSCFTLSTFLQLCDAQPHEVQFKGGWHKFDSPYIIILTNTDPEEQYPNQKRDAPKKWDAYMRRVNNNFCTDSIGRCDVNPCVRDVIYSTVVDFLTPESE